MSRDVSAVPRSRHRRISSVCRGLLGLITLGVLVAGLPIALYKLGGSPIPSRLPSAHQFTSALLHKDNGSLFIAAIRDISWLAWAAFTSCVIVEAQAAIRGRKAPRLRLAGLQGAAYHLVALAALTFVAPAAVTLAGSPAARAATVQPLRPGAGRPGSERAGSEQSGAEHPESGRPRGSGAGEAEVTVADRVIVVRPGDCLWTIAERYLGAGDKYPEIVSLNLGHQMGDGQVFTDPSLIDVGWQLQLPPAPAHWGSGSHGSGSQGSGSGGSGAEGGSAHGGHPSGHSHFRHPHPTAGGHAAGGHPAAGGHSADGHSGASHSGASHSTSAHSTSTGHDGHAHAGSGAGGTSSGQSGASGGGGGGTQASGANPTAARSSQHDEVVEVTLFTLGMVAGAALASIDRLRHRQRQERQPGQRIALPADPEGRRIERTLRGAAASWSLGRSGSDDQDSEDEFEQSPRSAGLFGRPGWPDRPEPTDLRGPSDLRGPAGNRLPAGGLEPFDADQALSYAAGREAGHLGSDDSDGDLTDGEDAGGYHAGDYDDDDYDPDSSDQSDFERGSFGQGDFEPDDDSYYNLDEYEFSGSPADDHDAAADRWADQYGSDGGQPGHHSAILEPDESRNALVASSAAPTRTGSAPASLRDALRELSEGIAVGGEPLPPIVGIHLTADTVDVLLSAPAAAPPPAPFTIAPARQAMAWTASLGGAERTEGPVPPVPGEVGDLLPGLFTAGATDAGGYLLLDLEAMRVTCCDGPDDLTDRMLVTAATELASSHWSGWYELLLVGCDELDVLGRAELCSELDDAIELLESRTEAIARRMDDGGPPDVRTRRMADPDDEDWGLTLLVSRLRPSPAQMARLLELADGPGGIAALVAGDTQTPDGKLAPAAFELAADQEHDIVASVTLAYLGPQNQITVWPQTLTLAQYQALTGVFATAADLSGVELQAAPYDEFAAAPWIRLAAAPVTPADSGFEVDFAEVGQPESGQPWFGQYELADPDSGASELSYHGLGQPEFGHPGPAQAGVGQPGVGQPGVGQPGVGQPGIGQPGAGQPRVGRHYDAGRPGHAKPGGADEPSLPRPQGARPRHAAPSLQVRVLGPVEITGSAQPLQPKQAELLLALALHAPAAVSVAGLSGLLGADADHPRPTDSVRQLIINTRKRLGQAPDGQEYIIHLGSGSYVAHADLTLDWANFSALARRGRADRRLADLRAAMTLVRGEPFEDCYHWWIDIALIETIRAEIIDTAELLSQLELASGDCRSAAKAARAGLAAEPAAEQLWRALMRAEREAGRPDGIAAAWTGCLDAIAEIAPGGEPHPDTEQLYRQLMAGTPVGSYR